jgi:gamma-glutamylcyclotransferase (GGCT)/AIG2-like uncharacterized protein YtfP
MRFCRIASSMQNLFVYGSLRRGMQNDFARLLHERSDFVGAGQVRGTLYDLGAYAGLVVSANAQRCVHGEVFEIKDDNLILKLDEYEGTEFERVVVDATLDSGLVTPCWVYSYRGNVSGRSDIPSGEVPRGPRQK